MIRSYLGLRRGLIVRLRSGGPEMQVVTVRWEGTATVTCRWRDPDGLHERDFGDAGLVVVDRPTLRAV